MKNEIGSKYSINIETITPVAIGCGEILSPLSDYWIEGHTNDQYACILDKKKWEAKLSGDSGKFIDSYLNKMNEAEKDKQKKNQFLADFIRNEFKAAPKDFTSGTPIKILGKGNAVQLNRCIQENNQLLMPGSSLKGAIKSAILYKCLSKSDQKEIIKEIVRLLNDRQVTHKDTKERRKVEKLIEQLITSCLESESREERKDFSVLRVQDAYYSTAVNPIWVHCKRFRLRSDDAKDKRTIPVFVEAIPPGCSTGSSMFFEENSIVQNTNTYLKKYFNDDKGIYQLLADINQYAKDNISYEKDAVYLKDSNKHYLNELDKLEDKISEAGNNTCYLPIGFGKFNFYQSIGLALYDYWIPDIEKEDKREYKYAFQNYLALYNIGKKGQKHMPVTRLLTERKQQPLGWIKITLMH